ncbi:MAG: tetratricopeptide repeat protein, partial [Bacteroidota bacterium]
MLKRVFTNLLYLTSLFFFSPFAFGQGTAPFVLWEAGKVANKSGDYAQSLRFYEQAAGAYTDAGKLDSANLAVVRQAKLKLRLGNLPEAETLLKQAENQCQKVLDSLSESCGQCQFEWGILFHESGKPAAALEAYAKAQRRMVAAKGQAHPFHGGLLSNIGNVYFRKGELEKAWTSYQEAREVLMESKGEEDGRYSVILNNLGSVAYEFGDYAEALAQHKIAYQHRLTLKGPDHPSLAHCHYIMALDYLALGQAKEAILHLKEAICIRKARLGPQHISLSPCYEVLASVYRDERQLEKALAMVQKSEEILLAKLRPDHPRLAENALQRAVVLSKMKAYEDALDWLRKAETIWQGHQLNLARVYANMASNYDRLGQLEVSFALHQKGLRMTSEKLGSKHPKVATREYNYGLALFRNGEIEASLPHFEAAYQLRKDRFGPSHPKTFWPQLYLGRVATQMKKYEAAQLRYQELLTQMDSTELSWIYFRVKVNQLSNQLHLLASYPDPESAAMRLLAAYDHLFREWERFMQLRPNQQDRQRLLADIWVHLEKWVTLAIETHQQYPRTSHLEAVYQAIERSRSVRLQISLKEELAKTQAGIPDSLRQREQSLQREILHCQRQMDKGRKQDLHGTTWLDKKLAAQRGLEELVAFYQIHYPAYFSDRYQFERAGLSAVQKRLKEEGSLMSMYWWGKDKKYVLAANGHGASLIPLDISPEEAAELREFVNRLRSRDEIMEKGAHPSYRQAFADQSYRWYQKLVEPVRQAFPHGEDLLIVPDSLLGALPFELLLTQAAQEGEAFRDMNFLLKEVSIRYHFFASRLTEARNSRSGAGFAAARFSGFAPDYRPALASRYRQASGLPNYREQLAFLPPLNHNQPEVRAAQSSLGGQAFLGEVATKANFLQQARQAQVLHLATHTLFHPEKPLETALVFSPDTT